MKAKLAFFLITVCLIFISSTLARAQAISAEQSCPESCKIMDAAKKKALKEGKNIALVFLESEASNADELQFFKKHMLSGAFTFRAYKNLR